MSLKVHMIQLKVFDAALLCIVISTEKYTS